MSIQVPLLVIDQRRVGSARLTFGDDRYYEFMSFDVPKEFGVLDEIGDMTRSLEIVET